MPDKKKSPWEAFEKVVKISLRFSNELRHQLAQAYQEYLNTLPPEHRELTMFVITEKKIIAVKRSEVPKRILYDDEFLTFFLKHIANIAPKMKRLR